MKSLISRLLNFLLCFQLALSCNSYDASISVSSTIDPVPQGFIRLNGVLSQAFDILGNSLMPSAVAAEGVIRIYDIKDPADPQEIYSQTISGTDEFKIDIKEEAVASGFIRVSFESSEDSLKNREYLTEVSSVMTADMNEAESFKSVILFNQLSQEVSLSLVDLESVKERFKNLNQDFDFDTEMNRFGSYNGVKNLLINRDTREAMLELITNARLYDSVKEDSTQLAIKNKFFEIAQKSGAIEDEFILTCDYQGASVFLKTHQDFIMETEAVELGLIEKSGQNWNTDSEVLESFSIANNRIMELRQKLNSFYEKFNEIYSLKISFKTVDGNYINNNECRIFPNGISEIDYSKLNSQDPSLEFQFDKKLFDSIDPNSFTSVTALETAYKNAAEQSLLELEKKLVQLKISSDALMSILENQTKKANTYCQEKINSISLTIDPLKISFDSSYLESVNLVNTANISEAYSLLLSNFSTTISQLENELLVVNKLSKAEALPLYKSQIELAGKLMNEKTIYFYDHYQILSDSNLVSYHADLDAISNLLPSSYTTLQDFQDAFHTLYNSSMSALEKKVIDENLSPSPDDYALMKDRLTMVSKIKYHEGTVYFNHLMIP